MNKQHLWSGTGSGSGSNAIDEETLERGWKGIAQKRVRARRVRRAWMAGAPIVTAITLVVLFVVRHFSPSTQATQSTDSTHSTAAAAPTMLALVGGAPLPRAWAGASTEAVVFDDGSQLELSKDAQLVKTTNTAATDNTAKQDPSRVDLRLDSGAVTFDIKPGGPRAWVIDAGGGTIVRVLGTRFVVARDAHHNVHVSVTRGHVRVENARMDGGGRDLLAGQDVDVPATTTTTATTTATPTPIVSVDNLVDAPSPNPKRLQPTSIAKRPEPTPASAPTPTPTPTPTTDRLAEADATRRAGRPRDAVAILTTVVDARDSRASLAAFTIGKIHAEELNEPAAAATWFERAIGLGLPGGLEEDAHARVVECQGRAGRVEEAGRAADRYIAKYPAGRHLARVQRWKR